MFSFDDVCSLLLPVTFTILGGYGILRLLNRDKREKAAQKRKTYDPNIGRPMGFQENLFCLLGEQGTCNLSNAVIVASKKPVTKVAVSNALEKLSKLHPLLRMCAKYSNDQPWFVPVDNFKVPLRLSKRRDWIQVAEDELLESFDSAKEPLWRATFLPEATTDKSASGYPHVGVVVFTLNHAIIDGISYLHLFNMFLEELTAELDNKSSTNTPLPLVGHMNEYMNSITGFKWNLIRLLANTIFFFQPLRLRISKLMFGSHETDFYKTVGHEIDRDPSSPVRTCYIPDEFNEVFTKRLLQTCRSHKVTVQAAVQAASGLSLMQMMNGRVPSEKPRNIKTGLTLNLRRFYEEEFDPRHLGLHISMLMTNIDFPPEAMTKEGFWKIACSVSKQIREQIESKKYLLVPIFGAALGYAKKADIPEDRDNKYSGRARHLTIFSNLGNCPFLSRSETSTTKFLGIYGGSSEHLRGPTFKHNLITFDGRLHVNTTYYSNIASRKTAEEYVTGFKDMLNMALSE